MCEFVVLCIILLSYPPVLTNFFVYLFHFFIFTSLLIFSCTFKLPLKAFLCHPNDLLVTIGVSDCVCFINWNAIYCIGINMLCCILGQLGKAPKVADDSLPVLEPVPVAAAVDLDADEDVTGMQARLEALRS